MTPEEKMKVAELLAACNNATSAKLIAEMYGLNPVKPHDNSSIEQFLTTTTPVIAGRATTELYKEYLAFCEANALRPRYIVQFVNYLTTTNGLIVKSIKGRRTFVDGEGTLSNVVDFLKDTPPRLVNGMINFLVYEQYQKYCEQHNYQPVNKIEFGKQVCRFGGYQLVDKKMVGVKRRVYIKTGP